MIFKGKLIHPVALQHWHAFLLHSTGIGLFPWHLVASMEGRLLPLWFQHGSRGWKVQNTFLKNGFQTGSIGIYWLHLFLMDAACCPFASFSPIRKVPESCDNSQGWKKNSTHFEPSIIGRSSAEPNSFWLVVSNIFYFHPYLGKWSNLTSGMVFPLQKRECWVPYKPTNHG